MKITTVKDIVNNVYSVNISTADFSQADTKAMEDFGEPTIDAGGDFGGTVDLATQIKKVLTESPFVQGFDTRDDVTPGDAEANAEAWALTIVTRLQAVMDTLRANTDEYSGESVITY